MLMIDEVGEKLNELAYSMENAAQFYNAQPSQMKMVVKNSMVMGDHLIKYGVSIADVEGEISSADLPPGCPVKKEEFWPYVYWKRCPERQLVPDPNFGAPMAGDPRVQSRDEVAERNF